jgi:hypothetical protein
VATVAEGGAGAGRGSRCRRALISGLLGLTIAVAGSAAAAATTADADPPTITFTPNPLTPAPSPTGWYRDLSPFGAVPFVVDFVDPDGLLAVGCTGSLAFSYGPPTTFGTTFGYSAGFAADGIYSFTCAGTDKLGNTGAGPGSSAMPVVIRIDATPPTVTCPPPPTFRKKSTGVLVASVADATSGPASALVSVEVGTRRAGSFTVPVTGFDIAGNSTIVECPYFVRTGQK